jgi:hypothetical protein
MVRKVAWQRVEGQARTQRLNKTRKGFVMDQTLALGGWLGMAGLALVSAHVLLWRQRRILSRTHQDAVVLDISLAPSDVVQEVRSAPSQLAGSASTVRAS